MVGVSVYGVRVCGGAPHMATSGAEKANQELGWAIILQVPFIDDLLPLAKLKGTTTPQISVIDW